MEEDGVDLFERLDRSNWLCYCEFADQLVICPRRRANPSSRSAGWVCTPLEKSFMMVMGERCSLVKTRRRSCLLILALKRDPTVNLVSRTVI